MGCSGETARTRLAYWEQLGVWQRLHASILEELHRKQALDLEVVVVDSTHVRAFGGGADSGPSPVNRRKKGVKYTIMTDGKGIPLAMISTPANTSDHQCLLPVVDRYPQVKGVSGRPRQRPRKLYADAGYDSEAARKELLDRGITPYIRKRNTEHGSGLGKIRWVVERTNSWLGGLRRFRIRYDRHQTIIDAWNHLALAALCHAVLIRQAA
jgi:transposase